MAVICHEKQYFYYYQIFRIVSRTIFKKIKNKPNIYMRLGHFLNVLAIYSECLAGMVREYGIRGFIKFIRSTLSGRWLVPLTTQQRLEANFQLRLI